jgi:hypothetical protein
VRQVAAALHSEPHPIAIPVLVGGLWNICYPLTKVRLTNEDHRVWQLAHSRPRKGKLRRCAVAKDGSPIDSDYMSISVISTSWDIMGGTPVFSGTRVPVQTLLDHIKAGLDR